MRIVFKVLSGYELRTRDFLLHQQAQAEVAQSSVLCTGHVLAVTSAAALSSAEQVRQWTQRVIEVCPWMHGYSVLLCDPLPPVLSPGDVDRALWFQTKGLGLGSPAAAEAAAAAQAAGPQEQAQWEARRDGLQAAVDRLADEEVAARGDQVRAALDDALPLFQVGARPAPVRFVDHWCHRTECQRLRAALATLDRALQGQAGRFAVAVGRLAPAELVPEINSKLALLTTNIVFAPRCTLLLLTAGSASRRVRPMVAADVCKGVDAAQHPHVNRINRSRCAAEPWDWDKLVASHPLVLAADGKAPPPDPDQVFMETAQTFRSGQHIFGAGPGAGAGGADGGGGRPPKKKKKKMKPAAAAAAAAASTTTTSSTATTAESESGWSDARVDDTELDVLADEPSGGGGGGGADDEDPGWQSEEGPMRLRRAETVLRRRTGQLMVVLDRCYDSHNAQAVLRTCDALGVQHVWLVVPDATTRLAQRAQDSFFNAKVTRGIERWLSIRFFQTSGECVAALREAGRTIWVADLLPSSEPLERLTAAEVGQAGDVALVIGREADGVSAEFRAHCDRSFYLHMCGFVESLNLSVAAALFVHTLLRLADEAPGGRRPLPDADMRQVRAHWFELLVGASANRGRTRDYSRFLDRPPHPVADLRRDLDYTIRNNATAYKHNARLIQLKSNISEAINQLPSGGGT